MCTTTYEQMISQINSSTETTKIEQVPPSEDNTD